MSPKTVSPKENKSTKKQKEIWQRLIEESNFKRLVEIFRYEHNIPHNGFESINKATEWLKADEQNKTLLSKFIEQIFDEFEVKNIDIKLEKYWLRPAIWQYVALNVFNPDKDLAEGYGCFFRDGRIMFDDLSDAEKKRIKDSVVLVIEKHATLPDVKNFLDDNWERIEKSYRFLKMQNSTVKQSFRVKTKRDERKVVWEAYCFGILDLQGRFTEDYSGDKYAKKQIPERFMPVNNFDVEARKAIIYEFKNRQKS